MTEEGKTKPRVSRVRLGKSGLMWWVQFPRSRMVRRMPHERFSGAMGIVRGWWEGKARGRAVNL